MYMLWVLIRPNKKIYVYMCVKGNMLENIGRMGMVGRDFFSFFFFFFTFFM